MGLIFGAHTRDELPGPLCSRWERSVAWFRSTYPNLTVREWRQGSLIFATALASPLEQRELRGDGWQAVLAGNFADCDFDEARARDVHQATEQIARAEGRFGGVVWDQDANHAFAVTDALGWYMLYWAGSPEAVVFSSHLGLLLRLLEPRPPIDTVGAAQVLMLSYLHGRRTCFEGVSAFLPGQRLALHRGEVEATDFDLPFSTDGFGATPRSLQDRFREALLDSVRRRIEGHARVFLPLSSGFDSRLIGACLRDLGADVVCATHDWRGQADCAVARKVARVLGFEHEIIPIRTEEMVEGVRRAQEMLLPASAETHVFLRKALALEKVGICLSGSTGDCMEGVNLPRQEVASDEMHDLTFGAWRQALWSDEDVKAIGHELGLALDPEAVYAESLEFFRAKRLLPFQQCIWWDYHGFQRRGVSYVNAACDLYIPAGAPYVDRRVWAELLSWPRRMLTARDGVRGMLAAHWPALARIPATKGGFRDRIVPTVSGAIFDGIAWRIPTGLRRVLPFGLGGYGGISKRNWLRLVGLLHRDTPWLTAKWLGRCRSGVLVSKAGLTRPVRFAALAALLEQLSEHAS